MGGVDIQFSVIVVEEAGSRKPDTLRLQIGRLCHQSHTITLIISTISFFSIKTHFHYNRILKFSSWHPFHDSDQNNADLMGSICRRNMNITNIELNTLSLWCSWFHKYSLKPLIFLQHSKNKCYNKYFCSILFADIVGFTNLSSQCSAQVKISFSFSSFILDIGRWFYLLFLLFFHKWEKGTKMAKSQIFCWCFFFPRTWFAFSTSSLVALISSPM